MGLFNSDIEIENDYMLKTILTYYLLFKLFIVSEDYTLLDNMGNQPPVSLNIDCMVEIIYA